MEQKWATIKNYSHYQVSNDGCVRNIATGCLLKPMIRGKSCNYLRVDLTSDNGVRKHKNIHRLVAEAFVENPLNKPCVNHIDGNKQNNNAVNLEWVTQSENSIHAFKQGLRRSTSRQVQKAIDSTRRPVINKTTGKMYRSIKEAADAIGGKSNGVWKCVSGNRKRYMGMEFEAVKEVVIT